MTGAGRPSRSSDLHPIICSVNAGSDGVSSERRRSWECYHPITEPNLDASLSHLYIQSQIDPCVFIRDCHPRQRDLRSQRMMLLTKVRSRSMSFVMDMNVKGCRQQIDIATVTMMIYCQWWSIGLREFLMWDIPLPPRASPIICFHFF